jgi:peptidyl-prolyl cis-trans isomerase SurA
MYLKLSTRILSVVALVAPLFLQAQTATKKSTSPKTKSVTKSEVLQATVVAPATAPVDPVLLTVGGDPVTKAEFENIYRKNNPKDATDDRKALEEYLELFINFKLKVKAAKEAGKDTSKAFLTELKGYRRQLAQPYLSDKDVNEKLIEEAYERMKKDVRASHILIKLDADPLPKDTLIAYKKAISIRERLLKGENFADLARQLSDDPSGAQNGGDLGYFTSMMMVYPFETAAYSTPVGQISMPVRTRFGYHILRVTDVRETQGQIKAAHIMVRIPENAPDSVISTARKKIDELYMKVKAGEDFGTLAMNFSDDRTTGKNGGQLPWFGTGKMVPEFEAAAFSIKENNQFSEPFRSPYGFHIVKRLDRKGLQPFDELKSEIKQKVSKDSRSSISRNAVIARVKAENNFTEDPKALDELLTKIDTAYLSGKWSADKAKGMSKKLFSIGAEITTQEQFASYLADNQSKQPKEAVLEAIVRKAYDGFRNDKIIAYEDARLEEKYIDFRLLMQEYRDGILLFEITDENVWSKAIRDSAGLKAFHEQNLSKYMWPERADAAVFTCKDAKIASKARKMVSKREKKNYKTDDILKEINKDSQLNLQVEEGLFAKGDNELVDKQPWAKGLSADIVSPDGTVKFIEYKRILEPQPKALSEARGLITADYQNYLEQQWIKELRKKYTVDVNREVLQSIR